MSINISSTPFTLPTTPQLPPAPVAFVTGSTYNFASSDAQGYTVFTSNSTVTITAVISTGICPVGSQIVAEQAGTAGVVFVSGSTVVVFNPVGVRGTLGQYAVVSFFQKSANVWTVSGSFL